MVVPISVWEPRLRFRFRHDIKKVETGEERTHPADPSDQGVKRGPGTLGDQGPGTRGRSGVRGT